jgi:exodeoxyribonuclease V beta subunit
LKLRDALQQPAGAALAAAVRSRYEAALIDEFQDTDPVQYAIFHKLFADAGRCLFLIGDPKQAIYSFRGADVFAYMEAARDIPDRFTLGINWRSEPALIQAVNTLFQTRPDPFVYPEIGFLEVKAPEGREPQALTLDGQPLSPLAIWFVRSDAAAIEPSASRVPKGPARIAKGAAKPLILAALAAEIARLLSLAADGQVLVGDRPLRENDLAVLLRTNREAREVKETLAGLGIPAVLYSTDNVFDSREALEMERLLRAIATPHDERLLRAALATDMLGAKGDDLVQMATEAARWEELLLDFRGYAQLWAEHGFIRIFRRFMLDHGVRARLMGFPDGDRRLTNTLHLAEILHQEAVHEQLGMVDLLRWFAEQRNPDTRTTGEQQLRLESDDNAIKLVTIHKSKGLQYPVVFCPFLWEGSKDSRRDRTLLFHDETDARRLTLDLGTLPPEREQHQAMAARETLAENLRLLYVALTRAQKHCTLVWGCFNQADTAAPAYLFHHRGSSTSLRLADETEASFKALDDTAVINQLRDLERKAGKTITLCELPLTAGSTYTPVQTPPESLTARVFQGSIEHHWRVSSFSAITSHKPREGEWPDRDETDVPPSLAAGIGDAADITVPTADIFRFPAGARPGTLLHDILEHLDFTSRDPEVMATLVGQKLEDYGFEPEWRATLCAMLDRLLKAPLGGPGWTFTLADIPNQDRLNELQFYFPLERLTPERLREAFASVAGEVAPDLAGRTADLSQPNTAGLSDTFLTPRSWTSWLNRLQLLDFTQVHGFMRGFMDLVFHFDNRFYLVDWKSNHLGDSVEDYDPRGLADAMVREYYLLQYHLYVVALDRYLAMRLPGYRYEDHFGGVYYVFLRGVHPDVGPHYGVFRDRPPQTLIETLSSTLLGERF